MAGSRASKPFDLNFAPGVYSNATARDARNRWKSSNNIRWYQGYPEKLGGFSRITLTGFNSGVYLGVARALHDWSTLDDQQFIAIGTHSKLQLVNNATLYDITPTRKSSNVTNPFTTTNGLATVSVADVDHRAEPGDYVYVTSSSAVGGLTISGTYSITSVTSPDVYVITAASTASSGATGGGGTTLSYDINSGFSNNGELLGYGTGTYGSGTYGTPRSVGAGLPARLRTWSLDNWGEDLVACPSGGALYWWDKTNGPSARAQLVSNAPAYIERILVNPENRFLIALGCSGLDGTPDPMRVRWASQEDFNDWVPTDENTAGGKRLDYGSRLITGLKTRSQILLWTDTQLYLMEYLAGDLIFGFSPLGTCSIVGPNAACDANGIAMFMGFDDFYVFDGSLHIMPCDVHAEVFGDFDRMQTEKVTCSYYHPKAETRWEYPSDTGTGENDRWVAYNRAGDCWYTGQITRTAYHGVSRVITGYMTNPYGANNGYLYTHETGNDQVDGTTTVLAWHLESYDINFEGLDDFIRVNGLIPSFYRITGSFNVYLKKKSKPQRAYQTRGPWVCTTTTDIIDAKARGCQIAVRFESGAAVGQDVRFGAWQVKATTHGSR